MPMAWVKSFALVSGALFAASWCQAQDVGHLSFVREVFVTHKAFSEDHSFGNAKQNQSVFNGQGVRTLKRSMAEVSFNDGSMLRLNERTDFIVQDTPSLRRIQLSQGAVWVKVKKGQATIAQTPTVTAAARGTEFVFSADGSLIVLQDDVELTAGGKTVVVHQGQKASIGADGKPTEPVDIPLSEMPISFGGTVKTWWEKYEDLRGDRIYIDPDDRNDPLYDVWRTGTSGNGLNVIVRSPISRVVGPTSFPRPNRIFDRTDTSLVTFAIGLGLGIAADFPDVRVAKPVGSGQVYSFWSSRNLIGTRLNAATVIGKNRVYDSANIFKPQELDVSEVQGRPDSVLQTERTIRPGLNVFAGRRAFYHGPVHIDQLASQLIADRYSAAGLSWRGQNMAFEGGWVYDANGDLPGVQTGGLGSLTFAVLGGRIALHAVRAEQSPEKFGRSFSFDMPAIPGQLEVYGEVGKLLDTSNAQTYGLYFPSLYQATDLDLFVEFSKRTGVKDTLSVVGERVIIGRWKGRLGVSTFGRSSLVSAGLSLRF